MMPEYITKKRAMDCVYEAFTTDANAQDLYAICRKIAKEHGIGWVSVKDRMPENEEIVIGYTPCDGYMFIGFCRTYKSYTYEWSDWNIITSMRSTKKNTKKVTHWMPLPKPPKEVNSDA